MLVLMYTLLGVYTTKQNLLAKLGNFWSNQAVKFIYIVHKHKAKVLYK